MKKATQFQVALVAARRKRQHTQKDAAEVIGVGAITVSRWERGVHCPRVNSAVASYLQISTRELGAIIAGSAA